MKKIVSIISVFTLILVLSSCNYNPTKELKLKDMFTDQEKTLYILKRDVKQVYFEDNIDYQVAFEPKLDFNEYETAFNGNADYKATKVTDRTMILKGYKNAEGLILIKVAENYCEITNPYVALNKYSGSYGQTTGPYLYFPLHLMKDDRVLQVMHTLELGEEYEIAGTKEEFTDFYINSNKFNIEKTEDGFLLKGYREGAYKAEKFAEIGNYQFKFSEKDNKLFVQITETDVAEVETTEKTIETTTKINTLDGYSPKINEDKAKETAQKALEKEYKTDNGYEPSYLDFEFERIQLNDSNEKFMAFGYSNTHLNDRPYWVVEFFYTKSLCDRAYYCIDAETGLLLFASYYGD